MSLRRARAITYGVVALLSVAAILYTRPLPSRANVPAAEVLARQPEIPWRERYDTVRRNESLASVLARGGVSEIVVREALAAAKMLDPVVSRAVCAARSRPMPDSVPTEIILKSRSIACDAPSQ